MAHLRFVCGGRVSAPAPVCSRTVVAGFRPVQRRPDEPLRLQAHDLSPPPPLRSASAAHPGAASEAPPTRRGAEQTKWRWVGGQAPTGWVECGRGAWPMTHLHFVCGGMDLCPAPICSSTIVPEV